jgi:hypothetical protein
MWHWIMLRSWNCFCITDFVETWSTSVLKHSLLSFFMFVWLTSEQFVNKNSVMDAVPLSPSLRPKYSPLGTKSRPIKIPTDKNRIKGLRTTKWLWKRYKSYIKYRKSQWIFSFYKNPWESHIRNCFHYNRCSSFRFLLRCSAITMSVIFTQLKFPQIKIE